MNKNDRLKMIRAELNLSQRDFAERLGVTDVCISRIEKGQRKFTDQMIKAVCHEFNVDLLWLETGEGEMFLNLPETFIDELVIEYDLDDLDKSIILEYLKLDKTSRNVVKSYLKNIFDATYKKEAN